MSAFLKMKKDREAAAAGLAAALKKTSGSHEKDNRYFYPQRDANGNGQAVIRFLPGSNPDGSEPFVKTFSHGFQGNGGKWLIEECPTTLGKECPICEANSEAWNKGKDYYEKNASHRKRKTQYIANILVVSDPKNPEREGSVMLFKFGSKIYDMINSAANPEFEGDRPINVFDPWHGADFDLRIVKKDNNTNYDRSKFKEVTAISNNDDEIVAILEKQYDLVKEFLAPSKFKDYEELKKKFFQITANTGGTTAPTATRDEVPSTSSSFMRSEESSGVKADIQTSSAPEESGEEDPVEFFKKLANGS